MKFRRNVMTYITSFLSFMKCNSSVRFLLTKTQNRYQKGNLQKTELPCLGKENIALQQFQNKNKINKTNDFR